MEVEEEDDDDRRQKDVLWDVLKLTTTSSFLFLILHPPDPGSFVLTISLSTYLMGRRYSFVELTAKNITKVYETASARSERPSLSNGGTNLMRFVVFWEYVVTVSGICFFRKFAIAGVPLTGPSPGSKVASRVKTLPTLSYFFSSVNKEKP